MADETEVERLLVRITGDASELRSEFDALKKELANLKSQIGASAQGVESEMGRIVQASEKAIEQSNRNVANAVSESLKGYQESLKEDTDALGKIASIVHDSLEQYQTLRSQGGGGSFDAFADDVAKKIISDTGNVDVADAARTGLLQEYQRVLAEGEKITQSVRTESEQYAEAIKQLQAMWSLGAISSETYARAVDAATKGLSSYQEGVQAAANAEKEYRANVKQAAANAEASFKDDIRIAAAQAEARYQAELSESNRLQSDANKIIASTRTEAEVYAATISNLDKHLDAGRISQEQYNKAAADAKEKIDATKKSTEEYVATVRNFGLITTAAGAAMTAAFGGTFYKGLKAFEEGELASVKLNAAIEQGGRTVAAIRPQYDEFADHIQRTTVVSNTATKELLGLAESYGVSGTAAQRAVKNAIALNAARGVGLQQAMKLMSKLAEGDTTGLTRLMPELKGIKDESERAAKAQEILGKMFSTAEAEAQTFSGSTKQLKNAISDVMEDMGKRFAEDAGPFVKSLKDIVEGYHSLSPATKSAIASTVEFGMGAGVVVTSLGGAVTSVGAFAEQTIRLRKILQEYPNLLTNIGSGALKLGIVGAAAWGMWSLATRELNKDLADVMKSYEALETTRQSGNRIFQNSIKGQSKDDQLAALQRKKDSLIQQINSSQREHDALAKRVQSGDDAMGGLGSLVSPIANKIDGLNDQLEAEKKRLAALKGDLVNTQQQESDLKDKPKPTGPTPEDVKDADEFLASLKMQAATMRMTADEAKIYQLQLKGIGADQIGADKLKLMQLQVAQNRVIQKTIDDEKRHKDAVEDARKEHEDLIQSMNAEIDTFNMSSAEAKIYHINMERAAKGVEALTEAQADQIRNAQANIDMLKDQKKAQEEVEKLREKSRTPQEKFNDREWELVDLYVNSDMSYEELEKFIAEAQKELDDANLQSVVKMNFDSNEAVFEGTAEYNKLMANRLRNQGVVAQAGPNGVDVKPKEDGEGHENPMVVAERKRAAAEYKAAQAQQSDASEEEFSHPAFATAAQVKNTVEEQDNLAADQDSTLNPETEAYLQEMREQAEREREAEEEMEARQDGGGDNGASEDGTVASILRDIRDLMRDVRDKDPIEVEESQLV